MFASQRSFSLTIIIVLPPIFDTWEAKNFSWNLAWSLSETKNGVIHALCLENVDDFMLACSDSPFGNMSLKASTTCMNGELWSHECLHSAAHESHKPTTNTPEQGGFEISFTEYAKEISIITLPSHRRRDRKSQITPLELSQLRALKTLATINNRF